MGNAGSDEADSRPGVPQSRQSVAMSRLWPFGHQFPSIVELAAMTPNEFERQLHWWTNPCGKTTGAFTIKIPPDKLLRLFHKRYC